MAPVPPFQLICRLTLLGNLDASLSCSWGAWSWGVGVGRLRADAKGIYTAYLQLCSWLVHRAWLTHKPSTLDKGHLRVFVVGPSPQSVHITQDWAPISCLRWVTKEVTSLSLLTASLVHEHTG